MTKKEKTMEELLEKVNMAKLKEVGVNQQEIAKIEALHDLLRKGKTWKDEEVKHLFGVLPDSFPFCTAYVHNEILVRIGKAKPIKVVQKPGEKDSRLKWVPIDKAEELGIPAAIPIKGYEIICAGCGDVFVSKEPFHQNFDSKCIGRKSSKQIEEKKPDQKSKPKKDKLPPTDSTPPTEKPKRRGRPPKSETKPKKPSTTKEKPKAKRGRPPKKRTSSKSKRASSRPTKTKGGTRKKK